MTQQKTKRRNRSSTKSKKNRYFTKVHEDAIVQYARTEDKKVRTVLYIDYIQPAFNEMVDKIVYTYKFNNLPNIDCLKDECKIWLTTILDKFNPNTGSKAFSYFSVITKNWFIQKVKKNQRSIAREIYYDDISGEIEQNHMVTFNTYDDDRTKFEFWNLLWKEMQGWEELKLKDNERRVLEAIKILFETVDDIEIFNKKAIYLYIREITGLNTKQVVNNLNKMRERYRSFKRSWDDDKI
jgi:hypothetical protein